MFELAVTASRTSKHYKNKKMSWEELCDRCRTTGRTSETYSEYMAWTKDLQGEAKDQGGFVGGYLKNGVRKAASVVRRSLLTLDLDYAKSDTIELIRQTLEGRSWLIYSTHKHCPDKPRYRLVVPLARSVPPDEYEAAGRVLADQIGMELFDPTSFQPSRLMYWPTTSYDGEFVYQDNTGELQDPDELLNELPDWKDISCWPGARVKKSVIDKAEDPLTKGGVIGAFCQTYTIAEAIEKYLPDIYEETDKPDRWTFAGGSTYAGVVVYNDTLLYSHHATDPCGDGHCVNAFDMVRIHKYGTSKDSFGQMCELALKDKKVRHTYDAAKMAEAFADFGDAVDLDWMADLDADKNGQYRSTVDNVVLILQNDVALRDGIGGENAFCANEPYKTGQLPWSVADEKGKRWDNRDDAGLVWYIEKTYGISSDAKILKALAVVHGFNRFHPVRDYLNSLTWDGAERLDTLFVDFMGAKDYPYTRAVTRKAFTAAIARVMQPGYKYDTVLTLIGSQGIGKSEVLKRMGNPWFTDSVNSLDGKAAYETINGKWIVELGEMSATKKTDQEAQKQFLTAEVDSYRPAYGRRVIDVPRQCVFFGTTNDLQVLSDPTGGRRFWLVHTDIRKAKKSVFIDLTPEYRDQCWAEAYQRYRDGEETYLKDELLVEAKRLQEMSTETDEDESIIREYLETPLPDTYLDLGLTERRFLLDDIRRNGPEDHYKVRDITSVRAIWHECLKMDSQSIPIRESRRIGRILTRIGWEIGPASRFDKLYGIVKPYKKPVKI